MPFITTHRITIETDDRTLDLIVDSLTENAERLRKKSRLRAFAGAHYKGFRAQLREVATECDRVIAEINGARP